MIIQIIILLTLAIASFTDIRKGEIPIPLFPSAVILVCTVKIWEGTFELMPSLVGFFVWFTFYLLFAIFAGSGGGDAIMMGSMGFMIYALPTLKVTIISVVAYILTVITIVISKGSELDRKKRIQLPYAPFVGIGYAVSCIV
jgi:Flp pilus assembly protein protease CpaA